MSEQHTYRIVEGNGPRLRKRTADQKRRTREQARRDQQEVCVELSDYLPRPLSYAWEDARRGRQMWSMNMIRHLETLIDQDNPPTFAELLLMVEIIAWVVIDVCEDRGIPIHLPDPPTPVQAALLRRAA